MYVGHMHIHATQPTPSSSDRIREPHKERVLGKTGRRGGKKK